MIPDIHPQDIDAVVAVLNSGMLIQGEKVAQLEREIASYLGVEHAIAVSNGTATLHLSLIALGIGPGDEVIVPALSYIATANVIELVGATPIFVDVELATFNIDCAKIEEHITSRTKAIMPVHEFGLACDINEIKRIADKHHLFIIEDAACALGAKINDQFTGTFGDFGSFSFHPRKAITSGEGGLIVTNDEKLATKVRQLRNHGVDMSTGKMEFVVAGYNYRMTDIQAALVLSQFQRFDTILSQKQNLASLYFQELQDSSFKLPIVQKGYFHTWQSFHVIVPDSIDRDALILKMKEHGVGVNYGAQCIPNEQFYLQKYKLDIALLFPNALKANQKGLVLPLYEKLSEEDIKLVSSKIRTLLNE